MVPGVFSAVYSALCSALNVWTLLVLLAVSFYRWWKKPHPNFPPGPRGLPVIGVLPWLGGDPQKVLFDWGQKYGPVMSVRMANVDTVFLNNFDAINSVSCWSIESCVKLISNTALLFILYSRFHSLTASFYGKSCGDALNKTSIWTRTFSLQALVKQGDTFSGRTKLKPASDILGNNGLVMTDYGEKLLNQKRFAAKTLRR